MAGFLLGAAGMFATMYSTQAILPELGRDFGVPPARAGLTISAVVLALAVGAWFWGPLSDRIGRRRSLLLASGLLVLPTIAAGLAPTFPALLGFRAVQGLCMPGLLTVGVPYVMEAFVPHFGGRAMGTYVAALVAGGLIGRVGVALVAAEVGWRWAIGGVAVLPLAGTLVMRASLPDVPAPMRTGGWRGLRRLVRNGRLLRAAAAGSGLFFTFVGTFSYVVYRLESPPFSYGTAAGSLVFLLWLTGSAGPVFGRLADRIGWRRLALGAVALAACGLALSFPAELATLVVALGLVTTAAFSGVTAAQLGVADSTEADRGLASAFYFSCYYASGALGGYLPGLAWEAWQWPGVAAVGLGVLSLAATALLASAPWRRSRST
jgi:YNFM family putative membrane transporter